MNRFTVFFIVSIMMCFTTDLAAQDWANLNRFKSENLKIGLPKENEDRVVFMGNSITEGWIREVPEFFCRPSLHQQRN